MIVALCIFPSQGMLLACPTAAQTQLPSTQQPVGGKGGAGKRQELELQEILENSGSERNPKVTQQDSPRKWNRSGSFI